MGAAGDDAEDCGRAVKGQSFWIMTSVALTIAVTVSPFELEFVGAAASDGALNEVVPDPNHDMGHDVAQLKFFDFSTQFVSG